MSVRERLILERNHRLAPILFGHERFLAVGCGDRSGSQRVTKVLSREKFYSKLWIEISII